MGWAAYQELWALGHKVSFLREQRLIVVPETVTEVDVRTDLYSDSKEWLAVYDNIGRTKPPARATGGDPTPNAGEYTGDVYFLINGWRVVINLNKTKVTGVLYSDDYPTAFFDSSLSPIYPATVSAVVSSVSTGSGLSADQDAALDTIVDKVALLDAVADKVAQMVFTKANELDVNVQSMNDAAVLGNGTTEDKWRGE